MIKNYTKSQLPTTYAWDLLDSEIEFELGRDIGVNLIQKLIQLYALGVEHYESQHSYKYLYFKRKMNNLITSPILNTIHQNANTVAKIQNQPKKEIKQKHQELEKKILYNTGDMTQDKVKDILRSKQKQAEDINKKVKQSLGQQAQNIKAKLLQRKQMSQLKMSQSLIELTRHSSQSSFQATQPTIQKQKLKVDFKNVIAQSDQQQSVQDSKANRQQVIVEQSTQIQQRPIRARNNTLRYNQFTRIQQRRRPKSLSIEVLNQQDY